MFVEITLVSKEDKNKNFQDNFACEKIGKKIVVPLADDFWKCAKGLMFAEPKEISGILLDFRRIGKHELWTLFMKRNIDIYYLNENFEVVEKYESYPPISINPRTWQVLSPRKSARYVLELWAGTFELSIGEKVKISYLTQKTTQEKRLNQKSK